MDLQKNAAYYKKKTITCFSRLEFNKISIYDFIIPNVQYSFIGGTTLPKLNYKRSLKLKVLQEKKREYSQSFAIHGLSRIFHGTKHEKLFWLINLIMCFGISAFLVNSQVKSYFNKEVYNDEKHVNTEKTEFPTITICDNSQQKKYAYCDHFDTSKLFGMMQGQWRCKKKNKPVDENLYSIGTGNGVTFFGNPFNIKCSENCIFNDLFNWVGLKNHTHCAQYNPNGDATTTTDRNSFHLKWRGSNSKRNFNIYVHEAGDVPYVTDFGAFRMSYLQNVDLRIKTTKIKRLPAPYPSNCVTKDEEKDLNIFPGKYTLQSCSETIRCIRSFKECGDTYDYCRPYIPQDIKKVYFNESTTFGTFMECLRKHVGQNTVSECRPPCEETQYEIQPFPTPVTMKPTEYRYKIRFQFILSRPGSYLRREEKQIFSLEDLLGITGGTVGLFCGFSILSLIELAIYFGIQLFSRLNHPKEVMIMVEENKD